MAQGFVYILTSPNCDYIKIGGTERPINARVLEINKSAGYKDQGPWAIADFLHVTDWSVVERGMHSHFNAQRIRQPQAIELFGLSSLEARTRLRQTPKTLRIGHEATVKIFKNLDVKLFLHDLFQISGLYGSLDLQGAWTISILPKTMGGRWFTLNIGTHEVAFSPSRMEDAKYEHYIVLDRLLLEYPQTIMWIGKMGGYVDDAHYERSDRALSIRFWENFSDARKFLDLPGVRRSLVAYWFDALADMRKRQAKSTYARYHSYDAVAELLEYKYATDAQIFKAN